ncbi:MAG: TolC family protein [bacterium]|nr:TolC family protein [bacterium]
MQINRIIGRILIWLLALTVGSGSLAADEASLPVGESGEPGGEQNQPGVDRIVVEISTHHPRIRSRALEAASLKELAEYAGWKYPDPKVGVAWSNLPYKKNLPVILDQTPMTGIEFSVRQPIPFPGRLSTQAKVSDIAARQDLLRLAVEKNTLAYEFLVDASEAIVLDRLLRLNQDYARRFRLVSNVARTRYSVGRGSLADVSRAELNFSTFEQRSTEYEGRRQAKLAMLAYYLIPDSDTDPPDEDGTPADEVQAQRLLRTLDAAGGLDSYRATLLEEVRSIGRDDKAVAAASLDVAMADLELRAVKERRRLASMEYLPDFEVFASYREREKISGDPAFGEDFYSFGFTMTVPLWSALSAGSAVEAQEKRNRATRISRNEVVQRLQSRLRSLEANRRSLEERIRLYQKSLIPQATRARDSARLAYETGSIDFFALLESWNALFMQEAEVIRLRGERERLVFEEARLLNVIVPAYAADPEEIR